MACDDSIDLSIMAYKALKKSGKDPERVKEIEKNREFIECCHYDEILFSLLSKQEGSDGLETLIKKLMELKKSFLKTFWQS